MYTLKSPMPHAGAVEMICEKIMGLNILLNQFYAALAIFSALKSGGLETPPTLAPMIQAAFSVKLFTKPLMEIFFSASPQS